MSGAHLPSLGKLKAKPTTLFFECPAETKISESFDLKFPTVHRQQICCHQYTVTLKLADQGRSEHHVVLTINLCGSNFFI